MCVPGKRWIMKPYSMDLRERIIRLVKGGELTQEFISDVFGVSLACVQKLVRRYRETGSIAPDRIGRPPGTGSIPLPELEAFVREHPDATLAEIKQGCGLSE